MKWKDEKEVEQDESSAEAENSTEPAPVRRVEYRELFTQLRRVN